MGCWELAEKSLLISLFGADCESKASCGEPVHFQLHLLFTSGIEGTVVCKEKVPDCSVLQLCDGLQTSHIEKLTV